jgi:iron(III) transport system permease protein
LANVASAPRDDLLKRIAQRPGLTTVVFTVVLGVAAFLVLYPLLILLLKSFETSLLDARTVTRGLDNWRAVFGETQMIDAIRNTITLALTRQVIALAIGVALAWVIARTNVPGRRWFELGFWGALFLPTLTVTLGWIVLFDGTNGIVNQALVNWVWFIDTPPFDVHSWWGIVFVNLMTGTLAITVMLLVPAFRKMDASLAEVSQSLGASSFRTLWRVAVPSLLPAVIIVTLLGLIRSLDAFEVEWVLGAKDQIDVYATVIYREVSADTPVYGNAATLATMFLVILAPVIVLQQWISRRPTHTAVTGGGASHLWDLGRWKWPAFAVTLAIVLSLTVIPVTLVALSTITNAIGLSFVEDGITLETWRNAFGDSSVIRALGNSLVLGFSSSVLAMLVFTLIAYVTLQARFWGHRYLYFLTWLPTTLPGIVLSLGLAVMFLQVGLFKDLLLGSMGGLVIAVALGGITLGVQIVRSRLAQLGPDFEETSSVLGAGCFYTFRRIVLPLITPAVVLVGVLTFATAVRATSIVAILASDSSKPLSLLQLEQMASGDYGTASVVGILLVALVTGVALVARFFGLKVGLGEGT